MFVELLDGEKSVVLLRTWTEPGFDSIVRPISRNWIALGSQDHVGLSGFGHLSL